MKKNVAILILLLANLVPAATPLLGPAWSTKIGPAWSSQSNFAWRNAATSILANSSGAKKAKVKPAWIITTTLVDSGRNVLSDDNSNDVLYGTKEEAERQFDFFCRNMESMGWNYVRDGVYERGNTICNVFLTMIYVSDQK